MIPVELTITRLNGATATEGDDLRVVVRDSSTTVRDLATMLDLPPDIVIDGRTVRGDTQLLASGIGQGSVLHAIDPERPPPTRGTIAVHQIGGLAAGGTVQLEPGRYALGSHGPSRGALRFGAAGSPRIVITVHDHGGCELAPGSGDPVLVDGAHLASGTSVTTEVIDVDGALFRVTPAHPEFARRRADQRGEIGITRYRRLERSSLEALRVELPAAAFSTRRRDRLNAEKQHALDDRLQTARTAAMAVLRTNQPDIAELRARVAEQSPTLWERSVDDHDLLVLTALVGDQVWMPVDATSPPNAAVAGLVHRAERLAAVPVTVALDDVNDLDLVGPRHATVAVARRMLIEAAALHGPDVCRIVVASRHLGSWDFAKWLPHSGAAAALHEIVLLDDGDLPPLPRGVRRHVLALRSTESDAGARLVVDASGHARYHDGTGRPPVTGTAIGLTHEVARTMARELAPLRYNLPQPGPPIQVTLTDLLELDDPVRRSDAVLARWHLTADAPVPFVPVGRTERGLVEIGFGDHANVLVSGSQGSGRSSTLQSIVMSIAATISPGRARIYLIDADGERTFEPFSALPHVRGTASVVSGDPSSILGDAGTPFAGHTFVVIDELAALAATNADLVGTLVALAHTPRTHVIVASRRAGSVLSGALHDAFETRLLLDHDVDSEPALLSGRPERAELGLRPGLAWVVRADQPIEPVQIAVADTEPGTAREDLGLRPFSLLDRRVATLLPEAHRPLVGAIAEAARRGGWLEMLTARR